MVIVNIHLESFDKESFGMVKKLVEKGPIAISFAPIQLPLMKRYQVKYFRDLFSEKDNVLGQQGLNHECKKCMEYRKKNKIRIGPHHENYCLWFGGVSNKEQEKFMKEGKKRLKKVFEKEPELYVPPNHLFGDNTINIAKKMGYKWLTNKALIPMKPYIYRGILIVPESEPEVEKNNQVYIHGDRWKGNLNKILRKKFTAFHSIKSSKESVERIEINRKLKIISKIKRDLIKGFNMKGGSIQRLAELIYESKFVNSSIY